MRTQAPLPVGAVWRAVICLMWALAALAGVAGGDTVTLLQPGGVPQAYPGVTLQSMVRAPDGTVGFMVVGTDGVARPVAVAQVSSMALGEPPGSGAVFNLRVNTDGAPRDFLGTKVEGYSAGQFLATPAGMEQSFPVLLANIMAMERVVQPTPTVPPVGFTDDELYGDDSLLVDDEEDYDVPLGRMGEYMDAEGNVAPGNEWEFMNYLFAESLREAGISPAVFWYAVIASIVMFILSIITTIWLASHAFSHENVGWGIALAILGWGCCCLSPIKGLYVGKYDGAGKQVLTGMVCVEILLKVSLQVMDWMLK